jgi:hypothetical protein
MKSELVRPVNIDETIWNGLTPTQKKFLVWHERLHEIFQLKGERFLKSR